MFDAFFILERLKSMDQRPSGFLGLLLLQLIKMATDLRLSQMFQQTKNLTTLIIQCYIIILNTIVHIINLLGNPKFI